ncbi:hypothetical protein [Azohydromonas aeria]|uniref:hypothetical protein n=1 Tax=Azohydromonas aeria TaxID=2590212 RepID=UPI0012FC0F92|nr:hypothetical protein [Azohydromonas aeria]
MAQTHHAAILVTKLTRGIALLPALAQRRPDLRWQLCSTVAQGVFDICAGGFALAVVDADHAEPDFDVMLRQVMRSSPSTRLLIHADDPRSPSHADIASCGWIEFVNTKALLDALGELECMQRR